LKKYITSYYKGLFGPPNDISVWLDTSRRDDIPEVTDEENRILVEEFIEQEVKKKSCSKWDTINHRAQMSFLLNFIRCSRR
jgi:hypothetical protein